MQYCYNAPMILDPWANVARLNPTETRALQNQKLQEFITQQLYPFSPHYRRIFDQQGIKPDTIRSIGDLKHLPFTSKADFVATPEHPDRYKEFALQPDKEKINRFWPVPKKLRLLASGLIEGKQVAQERISREYRPCFMTFTGGTTGKPVPFLYSIHDINNLYVSGSRMLQLFEIKSDERVFNMFPYAPHLAFWQVVFGGFAECLTVFSSGGGKCIGTEGNIGAILRMRPSVIMGVPSYVYHVLRMAAEKKSRLDSVKKIVLGAARVTEGFKAKLTELLVSMGASDVAIFGTYGFTEAKAAWAECPTKPGVSSGYHLYPDKEIFEVVDPDTGEVKKEGEDGEIVYTALDTRCSTVVRYRTGDYVKGGIRWEPCPYCGRTVPRLSSDITRLSDIKGLDFSKIKGTFVNLNDFANVLNDMEAVKEWQIEIHKKDNDPHEVDEVAVYCTPKEGVDRGRLEENIRKTIFGATEVSPNQVVFVTLEDMVKRLELETANKERKILDNRPQ